MKVYLAGPMRGYAHFNFPAFHAAAKWLRDQGYEVFSPAEKDLEREGSDFQDNNPEGSLEKATKQGFSLRAALGEDLAFICANAEGIAMLPGWEQSAGASAEMATAVALDLTRIFVPKHVIAEAV